MSKVSMEPNTGCWLWTACLSKLGYGKFAVPGGNALAHRISWELHVGKIPSGFVLDHKCRQRSCVNPDHLRCVTQKQNVLENSMSSAAKNAEKTHCINGHPFNEENTIVRACGRRACRTCRRGILDGTA